MSRSAGAALCILVASAAATVALAAKAGQDESRPGRAEPLRAAALRPLMPAGARALRDRGRALRVRIPPGWQHTARNVTPRMADPVPILTVATFRPRVDPRGACGPPPDLPQLRIGPRDALLLVTEELGAQPGPAPDAAAAIRARTQSAPVALPEPTRGRRLAQLVPRSRAPRRDDRDRGRAHVQPAPPHAARRNREPALRAPRTSRCVRASQIRRPADPLPARADSHTPTGRRGRRQRDYRASVRGPQRSACVIENEAWFSHGPPAARLGAVLDPSRTKGQRRCRGRFRGVVRYRDALCRRDGSCWRTYSRTAGHFHFTVR